jgi:tRNA(Ile)-lysidine synthase
MLFLNSKQARGDKALFQSKKCGKIACMNLLQIVERFLNRYHQKGGPIILGYSGGSDSCVLLDLLMRCKEKHQLDLHLVHIDHGWREESARQAERLRAASPLPFHLRTFVSEGQGNLEMKAREGRLAIFKEIASEIGAKAVILAHQAEDLSETVLKKILEGAHYLTLHGMQECDTIDDLCLWRPLLHVPKKEIAAYLKRHEIAFIDDHTNRDERFLRARMRQKILPGLEEAFGKGVGQNLVKFAKHMQNVGAYFEEKSEVYLSALRTGPFGALLDFTSFFPIEEPLLSTALRELFKRFDFSLSYSEVEGVKKGIIERVSHRKILGKGFDLYLDRGRLFFLKKEPKMDWSLAPAEGVASASLASFIEGKVIAELPPLEYKLTYDISLPFIARGTLSQWYAKHKTPSFLCPLIPCLEYEGKIVHEFLTGKRVLKPMQSEEMQTFALVVKW